MQTLTRASWLLISILLIGSLVKFAVFSAHIPTLGYPNNYDFARSSACTGIWNFDDRSTSFQSATPDRIVNTLNYTGLKLWSRCTPTTEPLYLGILKVAHQVGDVFSIRELGYAKLAVLLAFYAGLMWGIHNTVLRVFLTACFTLLVSDFSTQLFFHALYPVFSSIYFSLFLIIATVACRFDLFKPHKLGSILVGAITLMLAFSNQ